MTANFRIHPTCFQDKSLVPSCRNQTYQHRGLRLPWNYRAKVFWSFSVPHMGEWGYAHSKAHISMPEDKRQPSWPTEWDQAVELKEVAVSQTHSYPTQTHNPSRHEEGHWRAQGRNPKDQHLFEQMPNKSGRCCCCNSAAIWKAIHTGQTMKTGTVKTVNATCCLL